MKKRQKKSVYGDKKSIASWQHHNGLNIGLKDTNRVISNRFQPGGKKFWKKKLIV